MAMLFSGIQWAAPADLGISQLYLNKSKLIDIEKWFDSKRMTLCQPIPVYDFGDGRLTLTDGHSRAFIAHQHKTKIPIVYDTDDIVTNELGQQLYKNDIAWCRRFNLQTVADLEPRIVGSSQYQCLWVERCERAYNLLTKTKERERLQIERQHTDLFLYGANAELTLFYFENQQGQLFEFGR